MLARSPPSGQPALWRNRTLAVLIMPFDGQGNLLLDPQETLGIAFEIYALPTVVIIDPQGRVAFTQPGITDAATLRRALSEAGSTSS